MDSSQRARGPQGAAVGVMQYGLPAGGAGGRQRSVPRAQRAAV